MRLSDTKKMGVFKVLHFKTTFAGALDVERFLFFGIFTFVTRGRSRCPPVFIHQNVFFLITVMGS